MNQDELDTIADDLVGVFALFHKHVMKIDNFKAETSLQGPVLEGYSPTDLYKKIRSTKEKAITQSRKIKC